MIGLFHIDYVLLFASIASWSSRGESYHFAFPVFIFSSCLCIESCTFPHARGEKSDSPASSSLYPEGAIRSSHRFCVSRSDWMKSPEISRWDLLANSSAHNLSSVGIRSVTETFSIRGTVLPGNRVSVEGIWRSYNSYIVIIFISIAILFLRKPWYEYACFLFIFFPLWSTSISSFLEWNSWDEEKEDSDSHPSYESEIRVLEGDEWDPEPKNTFSEIIRMTWISIESWSEYLSWFFDLDELAELSVCNRLKHESCEGDDGSDDDNELLWILPDKRDRGVLYNGPIILDKKSMRIKLREIYSLTSH